MNEPSHYWTDDKPTEPGWYWYQSLLDIPPQPVRVFERRNTLEAEYGGGMRPEQMTGRWSERIPEPEEP